MQDNDIQKIKHDIEKLQEEIAKLRSCDPEEEQPKVGFIEKYRAELDGHVRAVQNIIDKLAEENKAEAIAVCINKINTEKNSGTFINYTCLRSFDELDDEGFASACEVFTNSHRIAILKLLAKETLTAESIGQKAMLADGQLYHHLAYLENCGLIKKVDDMYENYPEVCNMLVDIYAVLGYMGNANK